MHILISGSFWAQPTVGSGQYLHSLLRWLPRVASQHRYTLLLPTTRKPVPSPPVAVTTLTLQTPFDGRNDNLAKVWFEQVSVPQVARMLGKNNTSDTLLHIPYFAPPYRSTVPVITTIPDIIPLILPAYRGKIQVRAYMELARRCACRSNHIITFSRYSQRDITLHLDVPERRVSAIELAADERYRYSPHEREHAGHLVAQQFGLMQPFVYYVGGLDVRKNVAVLLHAAAHMRQYDMHPWTLAIAGRAFSPNKRLFPDLDTLIKKLNVSDVVRRLDVSYEQGPLFYQAATVFAFPSTYEGFGLPPLEAMACGTPVVCSNASSLPEVVGDAALSVYPDDVYGWATSLSSLLSDERLRIQQQHRSLTRAAQFSWRRVAEETVGVYERVQQGAMDLYL